MLCWVYRRCEQGKRFFGFIGWLACGDHIFELHSEMCFIKKYYSDWKFHWDAHALNFKTINPIMFNLDIIIMHVNNAHFVWDKIGLLIVFTITMQLAKQYAIGCKVYLCFVCVCNNFIKIRKCCTILYVCVEIDVLFCFRNIDLNWNET